MSAGRAPGLPEATLVWLLLCGLCDARRGRVPNRLTLPVLALAGLRAALAGPEVWPVFLAALAVGLVGFQLGALGGADGKVLAGLAGLWPAALLPAACAAALWGAGRRLAGRRGPFRALPAAALGAALWWLAGAG